MAETKTKEAKGKKRDLRPPKMVPKAHGSSALRGGVRGEGGLALVSRGADVPFALFSSLQLKDSVMARAEFSFLET